jgi:eukaryotic-like serine/threonine-protein kinase
MLTPVLSESLFAGEPESSTLQAGLSVDGRYELQHLLGRGGMGEVWSARHNLLKRDVAIKFLTLQHAETAEMLLQEAQVLASLRHPAIVRVFDFGTFGPASYLVMEQLRGETAAARLQREGPMATDDAIALILPIVRGLVQAHELGIVHRDIKPENILLDISDGPPQPKLIDFGIADAANLQIARGAMGTPPYMAPEQVRGEKTTPATDIWAIGITLYELVVGIAPFSDRTTLDEVLLALATEPLPYPRASKPLGKALWQFLTTCTRKIPSERYSSMVVVVEQLEAMRTRHSLSLASELAPASASMGPTSGPPAAAAESVPPPSLPLPASLDVLIKKTL